MLRAFLTNRVTWALTGVVVLAVLLPVGLRSSDAAFVAGSTNNNSLFSSATTFNTVFTTLTDPGTPLHGSVTLDAVASSDRGMGTVAFQTSPAGADTWTTRCTDTAPAYSCDLDTTGLTDGLYDLRVLATDTAGYPNTSVVADRRVDNTAPTATTTSAGSPLTGVATVSGTGSDAGSGVANTTLQYRPSAGGSWTDICAQAGANATCAWNTASLADGLYDVQTVATDAAGNTGVSTVVTNRHIDNFAPSATMTNPGSPLRGTVTLASTSADAANGTGVASVRYEYRPNAGGSWSTACTSATSPFSCSFDTTGPSDGLYEIRAVAIDGVAKEGPSAGIVSRRIDNTAPTATLGTLPAGNLSGSVPLTSTVAETGSGVASVQYQYKPTSGSTWTTIACAPTASPWPCSFNTATVADGLYDIRVQATDGAGNTGASTPVFSRRIDNTNPTVTMGTLPGWVDAAISLTSTPADAGGIASVQYQYKLNTSGTWLPACLATTAPYTCSFPTAAYTTGNTYDFRAFVTDNAGRTVTSAQASSRIDHAPPAVTMTAPAANIGGSVTLASTPTDAHSGVASVQYEYRVATTGTWTNACAASSTPWTCAFDTSGLADGLYDFRVIATDNVGRTATSAISFGRRVDNTDPGVPTLGAVGSPLSGSPTFTGTAADNGSGINNWAVQYAPAGTSTWTTLCSDPTAAPNYTCTASVATVPDGLYDFRALATDNAGNTRASVVQVNRRIDTAGPVASITSPANNARVHDTITMVAAASDPAGVAWVRFEAQITPGFWTPICTDNTASYTCQGDTTQVADGTYQIRVVARDNLGNETTSALTTLIVDNTHPSATTVNSASNGAQDGRIDNGDTITFTWSEPMAPASIMTGWAGGTQAIRVYVDDNGGSDLIHIWHPTANTRLNITSAAGLDTNDNYVNGDLWFDGTMTMAGNNVTVAIGALTLGTNNAALTTTNPEMDWNSSNAATDLAGNTALGNTVAEPGNDRDF